MNDAVASRKMIQNLAIAASAGSGKTYQLAHRYIGLLLRGVEPDRIVALTFSRKAAGEIFDSIIKYLVKAAGSESARLRLAETCGLSELPVNRLLGVLGKLLANLHRLQVGTLDSFAVRLLTSFPEEFGIDYGFEIIDNDSAAAQMLQREVLLKLLGGSFLKKDERLGFLEAFRIATFGREERRLADLLQDFIAEYHELYLQLPAEENWGDAKKIWPHGAFWQQAPSDIGPQASELAQLVQEELPEKARKRWLDFIEEVRAHRVGRPLNQGMKYFLKKVLPVFDQLSQGGLELKMDRQVFEIGKRVGRLCQQHIRYLLSLEMEAACRKTKGIHRVVSYYERLYEQTVRRRGRLTFNDVHLLLGPDNRYNRGLRLSSFAGEGRLAIDYRLDGHIDHWLLDEFQDTSTSQWLVLANLIDEVVQDDSGGRSFFYVGDVKQAIYRWRSGNADLFGQILRHYQGAIEQQPLDRSFRFCPPVTDAVNHVFADLPDDLPGGTVQDWRAIWRQHSCETSKVPKTGYVALIEPVYDPERSKPDAGDRYQVVASLLQELEPMTRNLSVAVLVRKNSQGSNLVQFLRSRLPGHAIVHEGSAEIAANPVCGLLLSLIEYSAHPGDTLALKHLQMSPLHTAIMATGRGYRILPLLVLERIQSQGFRGCLAHWGEELERLGGLDRYGRRKLQELLLAADRFDAANNRSCNDFLTFIKGYSYRQTAAAGSIRVMTVHQAKGLGFDVVLLPELQDGSMESGSRSDVALLTDPRSGQTSLLNLPQKIFAEADPVLAAAFAEQKKAAAFDELCTLYVAMTRAKKALYLITGYQGKNSTSFTQGALVKLQLHGEKNPPAGPADEICGHPVTLLYEKGKRRWYEEEKKQRKEPTGKPIVSLSDEYRRQASVSKMTQISPSAAAEHEKTAASLFSSGTSGSLQFGSGVHSLFEMLSWYSEAEESRAVAAWRAGNVYDTPFTEEVAAHFKAALAAPAVRKALGKPSDNALLWREREFDVVIDGHWVCGIFDRVAIEADREGRPGKATVQDYKTNRVDSRQTLHQLTEEYRPQMQLYRQALSLLLNLPQDRIDLQLIFTGIGEVVQLA